MAKIKIEKGKKLPPKKAHVKKKKTREPKYPFLKMEVGDSFLVRKPHTKKNQDNIGMLGYHLCKNRNLDWKFSVRQVQGGYRVFRIK